MSTITERVAQRFTQGFKHEPKESKQNKVDRLMRFIREHTGVSRSVGENIADAIVRGRDVAGLALMKGWPIDDGAIVGPSGTLEISKVYAMV